MLLGHATPDVNRNANMTDTYTAIVKPIARSGTSAAVRKRLIHSISVAFCCVLLAACAASPAARDELLQQRAQARWDALLAGDFAAAYEYFSPGYRSGKSVADFEIDIRSRRVQYVSAAYQQHACDETACTVKMLVGYRVVRPVAGVPEWNSTSLVEERWINSGGSWWFLPES